MPPKRNRRNAEPAPFVLQPVTLKECVEKMKDLPNADNSIAIWTQNIINLAYYSKPANERLPFKTPYKELEEANKDVDVASLLADYDRTMNIIETQIINKRSPDNTQTTSASVNTRRAVNLGIYLHGRAGNY
jgi:hypothetical protein